MDQEKYLQERLDDQIDWYDKKSQWNHRVFLRLRIAEIVAAALIPFLTGYIGKPDSILKIVVGLLGVTVGVIAGVVSICKLHEHWIEYRTTCETLRHHKYLFMTQSSPYDDENAFNILVENVESNVSKENSNWQHLQKRSEEKS